MMKRNYGIDALRMCAMYMVVILHVLAQGGVLTALDESPFTVNYSIAWFLEAAACCAVNCFALISGYVGAEVEFRWYKGITLWLQIVFWTVMLTIAFAVFMPQLVGIKHIIKAFFPVVTQQYWYVTAYFGTFLFIPYLKKLLNTLGKRELKILGITIAVGVSLVPTVLGKDLFEVNGGYSVAWILCMYLLGGIIKKVEFGKNINKVLCLCVYILAVFVTWGYKILIGRDALGITSYNNLYSYSSFSMLVCAVALLLLFSKLEVKSIVAINVIKKTSPLAFSVYIIHVNQFVWSNLLGARFVSIAEESSIALCIEVLAVSFGIYILCSLLDVIRVGVFRLFKVNDRCRFLTERFVNKVSE